MMREYEVSIRGGATLRLWAADPTSAAVQAAKTLRPTEAFVAVRDVDRRNKVWLYTIEPRQAPRLLEAEA
jgi:hypothetical protein